MRTNFTFGHGRIVSPAPKYAPKYALKYAFKNQTVKKEEKKPIAIAEDNENMAEGLKRHAILAALAESGLAQTQQTAETQNCNMQEDMDMPDGIPPMDDTDMGDVLDPLNDMDMTGCIEQEGVAQAQQIPVAQNSVVNERETIDIGDEEEQRVEAMFLRDDDDAALRDYKYKYYAVLEDLVKQVPFEETVKRLKITKREYLGLVLSIRSVEGKMYAIPKKRPKVRKATIGDNGAIVSQYNIDALGVSHIYPYGSVFIPVTEPITGWIMLKPLLSPVA